MKLNSFGQPVFVGPLWTDLAIILGIPYFTLTSRRWRGEPFHLVIATDRDKGDVARCVPCSVCGCETRFRRGNVCTNYTSHGKQKRTRQPSWSGRKLARDDCRLVDELRNSYRMPWAQIAEKFDVTERTLRATMNFYYAEQQREAARRA